jgi:hypothetical protein
MAVIDVPGYVAELKEHVVDHGFHVHDERHFLETYSLRQAWEVDLHPEEACVGPLDLHLNLEVEPRTLLAFEDAVADIEPDVDPPDSWTFPMTFTWALPPLPHGPDLLRLALDLSAIAGSDLPLEVSAVDSIPSATDAPERSLTVVAKVTVSLARIVSRPQPAPSLDRAASNSSGLSIPSSRSCSSWRRSSPAVSAAGGGATGGPRGAVGPASSSSARMSRTCTAWGVCIRKVIVPWPVRRSTFEKSGPSLRTFTDETVWSGMTGGSCFGRGSDEIDCSMSHSIRSR